MIIIVGIILIRHETIIPTEFQHFVFRNVMSNSSEQENIHVYMKCY